MTRIPTAGALAEQRHLLDPLDRVWDAFAPRSAPADITLAPGECLVAAHAVRRGDIVVATTETLADGRIVRYDHAVPYFADPRPDVPGCGCEGHRSLAPEDREQPLAVLYQGENWGFACDVVPAASFVVVCHTARPVTGKELW